MTKYRIYNENGRLAYTESVDGSVSIKKDASKLYDIIDEFINGGYKVIFDKDNLLLDGGDTQLYIVDYFGLFTSNFLPFLSYDVHKVISDDGYTRKKNNGRKYINIRKYIVNKVACFSLVFSCFSNFLPFNALADALNLTNSSNDNLQSDSSDVFIDNNLKTSEVDDMLASSGVQTDFDDFKKDFTNELISPLIDDVAVLTDNIKNAEPSVDIEKVYEFIGKEYLNLDKFINLLELMTSNDAPFGALYPDYESAIDALLEDELSYEVKFLIIMVREGNTYEEIDKMCAGVCGEATGAGSCYEDAYAVASSIINRTHKDSYVRKYGQRLYDQFCAPGQYEIELSGNYLKFLGQIDLEGYHAAIDAFYTRESMHNYIEFRANWVELSSYEMFVPGGNKFIARMKDSQYVPYPEEEIELDDVKEFVLSKTN